METLGKRRVRIRENDPEEVVRFKSEIADIIDVLETWRGDKNTAPASGEKQRLISLAQTKIEEASMYIVKAFYTK